MDSAVERKLLKAYNELLRKNADKITVTTLCEKADVSRASFYLYYSSIKEFTEKCREFLIKKLNAQAKLIITCDESMLHAVLKKKNLLLDETELSLLRLSAKGTKYIEFALTADKLMPDDAIKVISEYESKEFYLRHKDEMDYFFNGYIPMLFFGLTEYDEDTFIFEMKSCRKLYRMLYNQIKDAEKNQ